MSAPSPSQALSPTTIYTTPERREEDKVEKVRSDRLKKPTRPERSQEQSSRRSVPLETQDRKVRVTTPSTIGSSPQPEAHSPTPVYTSPDDEEDEIPPGQPSQDSLLLDLDSMLPAPKENALPEQGPKSKARKLKATGKPKENALPEQGPKSKARKPKATEKPKEDALPEQGPKSKARKLKATRKRKEDALPEQGPKSKARKLKATRKRKARAKPRGQEEEAQAVEVADGEETPPDPAGLKACAEAAAMGFRTLERGLKRPPPKWMQMSHKAASKASFKALAKDVVRDVSRERGMAAPRLSATAHEVLQEAVEGAMSAFFTRTLLVASQDKRDTVQVKDVRTARATQTYAIGLDTLLSLSMARSPEEHYCSMGRVVAACADGRGSAGEESQARSSRAERRLSRWSCPRTECCCMRVPDGNVQTECTDAQDMAEAQEDLSALTVSELKARCRARGLPVGGLKEALMERVQQAKAATAKT
ncbi:unnamed protein product [Effrenium voratum]|nr:unnamed protein product [Effrenium voratum]